MFPIENENELRFNSGRKVVFDCENFNFLKLYFGPPQELEGGDCREPNF